MNRFLEKNHKISQKKACQNASYDRHFEHMFLNLSTVSQGAIVEGNGFSKQIK